MESRSGIVKLLVLVLAISPFFKTLTPLSSSGVFHFCTFSSFLGRPGPFFTICEI